MNEYEAKVIEAARQVAELILADQPNIREAHGVWFRPGTKELVKAVDDLDEYEKWGDVTDPDPGVMGYPGFTPPTAMDNFAEVGTQWGRAAVGFDYGSNEILHINQIGSRLKLCGEPGGLGTWPSNATCVDCRKAYEASGDSERFQS